ncbi:MAG TPA: S1 RNA-binding domain-containing protein [Anaerolineaceae bacterium]|nr:S1 RNA-binding domain-containing protein [Anaerolineaceae bacterium]
MSDQEPEEEMTMEALLAAEGLEMDFPKRGDVRQGEITGITDQAVLVNIGAKSDGQIPLREFDRLSPEEREEVLQIGQRIPVYVLGFDSHGAPRLSYLQALEAEDWERAERMKESSELYEGTIAGYNKGGLVVRLGRLRGFIPLSQISRERRQSLQSDRPDPSWKELIGQPIVARVIEVDRSRQRLILSERAVARQARELLKERVLAQLQVGDVRTGRVTSLTKFGAFVNIDGADGLVHLSEISWEHIDKPEDVLQVGQEVQVKVISIDPERKRIGLSIRQLREDPWKTKAASLRVGQLVRATITRLEKFGAFARLENGLEGLIHISELSEQRIEHPKEVVKEGDEVTLRIIRIDPEARRIGLSLRKVDTLAYADLDLQMALAEAEEELEQLLGLEEAAEEALPNEEESAEARVEAAAEEASPEAKAAGESPEAALEAPEEASETEPKGE